jgi:hypothetical protein
MKKKPRMNTNEHELNESIRVHWCPFVVRKFFAKLREVQSQKRKENLNKRKQRKFEQKLTKLAKVRHLASEKLFFRPRSLPSIELTARFQPAAAGHKRPQQPSARVG